MTENLPNSTQNQGRNKLAIFSFLYGLIVLVLSYITPPPSASLLWVIDTLSVVAVILAIVALRQIKQTRQKGTVLAIGGIILNLIFFLGTYFLGPPPT